MFGTCVYLPLSSTSANEELPLDLSCKPRECSRQSPSIFLDLSRRSQTKEEESTNIYRSRFSTPIETKLQSSTKETLGYSDRTISTESATVSIYDSDSSDDSSFVPHQEETSRKDLSVNVTRVVTSVESRQPAPKRNRERTLLPCQVCGKAFDRPSLLKRHIRTHTGEKPHVCDVCGKGFSTSSSLNTHRRIHSGEKPHQCPICGKRFTASSNLYYHRMTHVKEKPHKCTMCHKSFPTPGDLKSHMYVHNGSWPFQCHVCKRGFSKQTNLRNHLFLHTGKKPHNCPQCGKCFALACNLRAHMRTHSEPGPFHSTNADQTDNTSVSEDTVTNSVVKSEPISSTTQTPDDVPPITPRLADHVFFWHTIQQQLANNIFVQQQQQQQNQINSLNFMSSPLARPFKFPK